MQHNQINQYPRKSLISFLAPEAAKKAVSFPMSL
jgi:hypothetical protein